MSPSAQALEALTGANRTRIARAADKARIRAGELHPATVVTDPPAHWRRVRVLDLLLAIRNVGPMRANQWLARRQVSPFRELGRLTARERTAVIEEIAGACGEAP